MMSSGLIGSYSAIDLWKYNTRYTPTRYWNCLRCSSRIYDDGEYASICNKCQYGRVNMFNNEHEAEDYTMLMQVERYKQINNSSIYHDTSIPNTVINIVLDYLCNHVIDERNHVECYICELPVYPQLYSMIHNNWKCKECGYRNTRDSMIKCINCGVEIIVIQRYFNKWDEGNKKEIKK